MAGNPQGVSSDGSHVWVTNDAFRPAVDEISNGIALGFSIITSSLPSASRGVSYSPVHLQVTGTGTSVSPYVTTLKWKKLVLPKGLKLSSAGALSGTPSVKLIAGLSSVTVQVTEKVTTLNGRAKVKAPSTFQATIPLTIN